MLQLDLARGQTPILTTAMRHARKDPIARLLATATAAGVRFRISGAMLQVDGADALHSDERSCLRRYIHAVRLRLEPPATGIDLLEELNIDVEVITDANRARKVLTSLRGRGTYGFDIETAPLERGDGPPWLKITKAGRLAVHQPKQQNDAGLDPLRAAPRLAQVYDPSSATVYVLDFKHVPIDVLKALEDVPLIIHNAAFEHAFLQVQGIHLRKAWCTLLLARLVYGAERGGLRLADMAADLLGVKVSKAEQASDWGAARLSEEQLSYAAVDAVVAYRIAAKLWAALDDGARAAFKLGNRTVPVVAAMKVARIPLDRDVHLRTISGWERSYAAAHDEFVAITGGEIPPAGTQRSAWLEARMPPDMLERWPRTETGLLCTRSADLERLAAVPEIRPLLNVVWTAKRLSSFGHTLLEKVGADGRLRMDLKPGATKTGRCSCSDPNLQPLPQDVRSAVETRPGYTLVIGDYSQLELRVAAELSGDEAMREVFRSGSDMHRLNAEDFIGASLDTLPEAEQEIARNKAKRIGFGTLYGSGPRGLVASAWSMYRIAMTEAEALDWKNRFYARYPRLRQWQNETADVARRTGVLRSVKGRPLREEWETIRPLKWRLCCNFPVQSSAADAMLIAMTRVHAALDGFAARPLLQIHDELVVECLEDEAPQVAAVLEAQMAAAWTEVFPDAPTLKLVDVAIRRCWAKSKKEMK
jgi:DNA polymerase-1